MDTCMFDRRGRMYESLASIDFNENFRELINRDWKEQIKRVISLSFSSR